MALQITPVTERKRRQRQPVPHLGSVGRMQVQGDRRRPPGRSRQAPGRAPLDGMVDDSGRLRVRVA